MRGALLACRLTSPSVLNRCIIRQSMYLFYLRIGYDFESNLCSDLTPCESDSESPAHTHTNAESASAEVLLVLLLLRTT